MSARIAPILIASLLAGLILLPPRSSGEDKLPPGASVPGDDPVQPGLEVQARGAVHEAYAEPTRPNATPGPIVPKAPPRGIDETPPEEKPEGDNVIWIPGYWSWDDETNEFLWISGFWRVVPPGRNWIPGSWQAVGTGYRWVSGYWGVASEEESVYLPPPPESLDRGPSVPAPAENYNYVPGVWVYQTNRYVWRPGYWMSYRPGWVWVPACYRWTPCGYLFVPGYWDMPLLDRGLLFAPVRFTTPVYLEPGFVYSPSYCVQPDFLCGALFVRSGYPTYFFGDYFAPRYRSGFTSWISFRFGGGTCLDLNFGYYRQAYRGFPAWERGISGLYAGRFAGTIAAPPRTLVQQRTVINNITVNKTTNNIVNKNVNITNVQNVSALAPVKRLNRVNATAMSSLANLPPGAASKVPVGKQMRVTRMAPARLAEEKQSLARFDAVARERRETERRLAGRAPSTTAATPIRAKIELPKGTPAPRVIRQPDSNVPPARPRVERQPEAVKPTRPATGTGKPIQPPVTPPRIPPQKPKTTTPTPRPGVVPPPRPGVVPPPRPGVVPPPLPGKHAVGNPATVPVTPPPRVQPKPPSREGTRPFHDPVTPRIPPTAQPRPTPPNPVRPVVSPRPTQPGPVSSPRPAKSERPINRDR